MLKRFEVRMVGGRTFCITDTSAQCPEGTAGEVRHYTEPMANVVEVAGPWVGCKFVLPVAKLLEGHLISEVLE